MRGDVVLGLVGTRAAAWHINSLAGSSHDEPRVTRCPAGSNHTGWAPAGPRGTQGSYTHSFTFPIRCRHPHGDTQTYESLMPRGGRHGE